VLRAAAMPGLSDAMSDQLVMIGATALGTGVNYASAKLGTQSYSALSLPGTIRN